LPRLAGTMLRSQPPAGKRKVPPHRAPGHAGREAVNLLDLPPALPYNRRETRRVKGAIMHANPRTCAAMAAAGRLAGATAIAAWIAGAAAAAEAPGQLTPAHVAEFKDVQAVRVEVTEKHEGTSATIADDVRRVAGHMLAAVGWKAAAKPDDEAQARLVVDLHGLLGHVPGVPDAKTGPAEARRAGRMAGAFVLLAGRAKLGAPFKSQPYAPERVEPKPADKDLLWGAFLRSGFCQSLARMLGDLRDPTFGTVLAGLLKDNNPQVRIRAADLIGHFKAKETWQALVAALDPLPPDEVVQHVGWALGQLNVPESIDAVVAAADKVKAQTKDETDAYLLQGLGRIDDPRARMRFIEKMAERLEPGNEAYGYAAQRIFEQQGGAYVEPLLQALGHENWAVRSNAPSWLRICLHKATGEARTAAVPRLIAALDARDDKSLSASARKSLVDTLSRLGDPRGIEALKKVAESDPDEEVRQAARAALEAAAKSP